VVSDFAALYLGNGARSKVTINLTNRKLHIIIIIIIIIITIFIERTNSSKLESEALYCTTVDDYD